METLIKKTYENSVSDLAFDTQAHIVKFILTWASFPGSKFQVDYCHIFHFNCIICLQAWDRKGFI